MHVVCDCIPQNVVKNRNNEINAHLHMIKPLITKNIIILSLFRVGGGGGVFVTSCQR